MTPAPRRVRWLRSRGVNSDVPVFDTTDGIAMAGNAGPTVILAFGEWRLYLEGRETLEQLVDAVNAAITQHAALHPV